jgi:hypothetical protein
MLQSSRWLPIFQRKKPSQSSGLNPGAGGHMFFQHIGLMLVIRTSISCTQVVANVAEVPKITFLDIFRRKSFKRPMLQPKNEKPKSVIAKNVSAF